MRHGTPTGGYLSIMAIAATAAAAVTFAASPAAAKIKCSADGFQIVNGAALSTPYCQDQLLGRVARQYGMKVSDAELRNNPNTKRHVCRLVGNDIRVQNTCGETNYNGRDRGY